VLRELLPRDFKRRHGIRHRVDRGAQPIEVVPEQTQEAVLLSAVEPDDRGQVRELLGEKS